MARTGLAALAVVLATALVPLGITSTWLSLRVDSTEAYVDAVAPLAEDPDLRDALAEEVAAAAIATLEERVPVGLPDSFRTVVRASTQRVVEGDGFPEFWRDANADAHREFLAVVHERGQEVDADGWVVIDIGPLVTDVLEDVVDDLSGLPVQVDLDLGSQRVPVPVVPESQLEEGRGAYQLLERLALWLPPLWLALAALAVGVAHRWRGRLRTAACCAVGVAVGGGIVLLVTAPVTDLVVDRIDEDRQDLARLVVEVVVRTLDETAIGAVVGGLVVGVLLLAGSLVPRRRSGDAHP